MRKEYFEEIFSRIKEKHGDMGVKSVSKDTELCKEVFKDAISAGVGLFKINDWVRSGLDNKREMISTDTAYFINLYQCFLERSMSDDSLADNAIELGALNIFTSDFASYFNDDSFFSKKSVIYKTDGSLRSIEFLSGINAYAAYNVIDHAIKIGDKDALLEIINNTFFDSIKDNPNISGLLDPIINSIAQKKEVTKQKKKEFDLSPGL